MEVVLLPLSMRRTLYLNSPLNLSAASQMELLTLTDFGSVRVNKLSRHQETVRSRGGGGHTGSADALAVFRSLVVVLPELGVPRDHIVMRGDCGGSKGRKLTLSYNQIPTDLSESLCQPD